MKTGTVTLVGAGPGGRALLTLAGAAALRAAGAVVYDHLVSEEILALIPDTAERIYAGKEAARHLLPQDEINALLVRCAREGKNVVRLKGGDCFLFGRGGEECEFLKAHGIPFRVIPGVSSALAAPALAGIPVTHRDFCSSVHIVTAHVREGRPPRIDYESLVKLRGTLVFLMGVTALSGVCAGLLAAGLDPDTPSAVVENGTRPGQRKAVAPVSALPARAREMALKSPAVIIVGEVCALSDTLDWFTPLPLHGKTVVVTRPKERAGTLSDRLRALGAEVLECPCIETVPRPDLTGLRDALGFSYDWAVFTSPTGVRMAVEALRRIGRDLRALYGLRLAAVGPGTAEALSALGLAADLIPERYDGAHLADALLPLLPEDGAVLLLRGGGGGRELPERLRAAGRTVADVALYDTVCRAADAAVLRERLATGTVDLAAFASASAVRGFAQAAAGLDLSGLTAACIGPRTAQQARACGMRAVAADNASIDELTNCILDLFGHPQNDVRTGLLEGTDNV